VRSLPQLFTDLIPGSRMGAFTALDIGPDAVVAVPCGASRGPAVVRSLPPGLVTDGEVTDAAALAEQLRTLATEHRLPRDVRVGLAHARLVVRTIEVPASLEGAELDATVRHFSEGLLPMAVDEVVLDYRRTGVVPGRPDQQRILIAAARLDGVERLMRALDLAGLRPRQVQLCGLALIRALDPPALRGEAVLYVQAAGLTNVVVAEDGEPVLVRVASAGSEAIAAGLAERAGISHLEARSQAARAGVTGAEGSQAAQATVREGLHRLVAEVHSSLEFYASREEARPVGAAVITGPMTTWPGVAEALGEELGLPVLPAGRDRWTGIDRNGVAPEALDVAVGLALTDGDEHPDLRPAARRRSADDAAAPRTAKALCGVSALLAAAIVYLVVVSNQLTSAEDRSARLSGQAAGVERQVAALKPYADFAVAAEARRQAVATIADSRFDWARVLRQLSEVTPSSVWLSSVRGTLTPGTQLGAGADSGATPGLRGARVAPALEVSGCAIRQSRVPAYMDRLRSIGRATDVGFSRAERLDAAPKGARSGAPAGGLGGDCRDGDERVARFDLVTFFEPVGAPLPAATPAPAAPNAVVAATKP
jgi:type IV pilus assembly protein PilM